MSAYAAFEPPISLAGGYIFLVLVGLAFAGGMAAVTALLKKHLHKDSQSAEEFTVAGRSLGVGLTATGVVSSWGWPTALLWSASVTYLYGASAGFWYSSCCVICITGFAVVANQLKIRAPAVHTALEMVKLRYGAQVHILFLFLMFLNSVIGVAMALLGASANISAITGIPVVASIFLIPFGVVLYTTFGGLRATILTDYLHTAIVFIILLFIAFRTITSSNTGGLNEMYRLLVENARTAPIAGNAGNGSYLTMGSLSGFEFGILSLFANMGLVVMDNSYWQKGIAASGKASVWGYLLGGFAYHALPFLSGTFGGLVALAYSGSPNWPTYPNGISEDDVNNSVTLVYTALLVAGKGGAGAMLVLVFMSMTSMASASVVGISGLATFDVYKEYFNRTAGNSQLVKVSHISVCVYGLFIAVFSLAIQYGKVSQGWLAYMSGIVSCPGLFPLLLTAFWRKQSKLAIAVSTLSGFVFGVATWLGVAYRYSGDVSIASTQGLEACLYGTAVSLFFPVPVTLIISLLAPDDFTWDQFSELKIIASDPASTPKEGSGSPSSIASVEKGGLDEPIAEREDQRVLAEQHVAEAKKLSKVAWLGFGVSILVWWVLVPWPMYGTGYVFSMNFFKGWLGAGIAWGFFSAFLLVIYPIIEGRHELVRLYRGITGRA